MDDPSEPEDQPSKKSPRNRILVYHLVLPEDKNRFKDHLKFLNDHFVVCSLAEMRLASTGDSNGGDIELPSPLMMDLEFSRERVWKRFSNLE